jgi:DEAD/DEAH box helicase domain-containing protein
MICHPALADYLSQCQRILSQNHKGIPDALQLTRNGMEQLKAFVAAPSEAGWELMTDFAIFRPLQLLMEKRRVSHADLQEAMNNWRTGSGMKPIDNNANGDWIYNDHASLTQDFISYISNEDALINAKEQAGIAGRLGDSNEEVSGSDFKERWRRFLACMNVYQFNSAFSFWTTTEANHDEVPEILFAGKFKMSEAWENVFEDTISSLKPIVEALAKSDLPVPTVEFVNESIEDDAFAEMAWNLPNIKVAVLAGDQTDFANLWQNQGWKVILPSDIEAKGIEWMINEIKKNI